MRQVAWRVNGGQAVSERSAWWLHCVWRHKRLSTSVMKEQMWGLLLTLVWQTFYKTRLLALAVPVKVDILDEEENFCAETHERSTFVMEGKIGGCLRHIFLKCKVRGLRPSFIIHLSVSIKYPSSVYILYIFMDHSDYPVKVIALYVSAQMRCTVPSSPQEGLGLLCQDWGLLSTRWGLCCWWCGTSAYGSAQWTVDWRGWQSKSQGVIHVTPSSSCLARGMCTLHPAALASPGARGTCTLHPASLARPRERAQYTQQLRPGQGDVHATPSSSGSSSRLDLKREWKDQPSLMGDESRGPVNQGMWAVSTTYETLPETHGKFNW